MAEDHDFRDTKVPLRDLDATWWICANCGATTAVDQKHPGPVFIEALCGIPEELAE